MAKPGQGSGGSVEMVVRTSVATFHNNLVTRPTGRAVRAAIEEQLRDSGGTYLALLDFTEVGVIDFSCADEIVGQLLRRYLPKDRPCEAYFVAAGVAEDHRDLFEAVLSRHKLLLVAIDADRTGLWGPAPRELRWAWSRLDAIGLAHADDLGGHDGMGTKAATALLEELVTWRVAIPREHNAYSSLPAVVRQRCQGFIPFGRELKRVAERQVTYGPAAPDNRAGGSRGSAESSVESLKSISSPPESPLEFVDLPAGARSTARRWIGRARVDRPPDLQ